MSDPASLRAAREEFDTDVREWAKELATLVASARGDSDEGWGMWAEWLYIKTLKWRDRLAALSGEPPAPTPEPADELLATFTHIESAEWIDSQFVLRAFYGDDADIAEFEGTPIETLRQAAAMYREALGVPPAAPTAATPDPREDAVIRACIGGLRSDGAFPDSVLYAAISDWHRRTLGGEPAP